MARIVFVSAAYWGDVMPFVPVAQELVARGHEVTFCVPKGFHAALKGHGLRLVDLGTRLAPDALAQRTAGLVRGPDPLVMARLSEVFLGDLLRVHLDGVHDVLLREAADADLLVTHPTLGFVTKVVAGIAGVPWITAHLFPMTVPSRETDPPGLRTPPLPDRARRVVRGAAWQAAMASTRRLMRDDLINAYREQHGLPPERANVALGGVSPDLTLMLSSRHYSPRPSDWPPTIRMTGFTVWRGAPGASIPDDLRRRLDTDDPPILITAGTSVSLATADLARRIAETLNDAGWWTVIVAGLSATTARLIDRRDVWTTVPLPEILPRVRAVVHTGGHGTVAATLTAGVPSVVIPQLPDQRWHARRIEALRVGVVLGRRRPRRKAIFEAVERATSARTTYEAQLLAEVLAGEDGPGRAADLVERHLARHPLATRA